MAEEVNGGEPQGSAQGNAPATEPMPDRIDPVSGLLVGGADGRSWKGLVILGWIAMFIFTWHACTRMVAAGDTWVAMACGRHFVNHGVDTVEPFSANSHHAGPTVEEVKTWPTWAKLMVDVPAEDIDLDMEKAKSEVAWYKRILIPKFDLETIQRWHPTGWVNQNWLTHVIFYKLATTMGSEEEPYFNALIYWKFGIYFIAVLVLYMSGRLLKVHPFLAAVAAGFVVLPFAAVLRVVPFVFVFLISSLIV
jgi:hypothetical protein